MTGTDGLIADRYRLLTVVGSGGMGVVWEAWDERLQRRVAVKQLRLPPSLTESEAELAGQRAMREARITARLHHRHAVSVFDVVDDDGRPCLVMQFVPSMTLAAVLEEGGPLQHHEAAQLGAEVASALAAAHDLGIVHRDVKPANVLIGDDGSALISDFGISRALDDSTLTATGMVHGTPAYLSPEAARGEGATFASDVYCLGATIYAALEGAPPFGTDTNSIALLHRVASGDFEPPRRSGALTPVLLEMMASDPSARRTMRTVASALEELASSSASEPTPGRAEPIAPPTVVLPTPVEAPSAVGEGAVAPTVFLAEQPLQALEPTPPPVAVPPEESEEESQLPSPPPAPRRRRGRVAGLVAALVAVGLLVAVLVPILNPANRGTVAEPPATTASAPQTPGTSGESSATASASPAPPSTPAGEPSTARPSPTASSRTPSPSPTASTATQLEEAITSYYALMPGDTARAWPLMTASYQNDHVGGRRAYERFWAAIDRVEVRDVTATPPDRAEATLPYYYADGRVIVERTSYELAKDDGTFKIDASTVLSSSTR